MSSSERAHDKHILNQPLEATMNKRAATFLIPLVLCTAYAPAAFTQSAGKAVLNPIADLKWTNAGIPGVSTALVQGDMAKGPSHFYLKYAAGFVAPVHHHSPDHYATTISGNLVLIAQSKEYRLAPGSYFAFVDKAQHGGRCEGDQDCVMFIDARGPWDVVPANPKAAK
jgi:quercetin dioxygenase-like cupin family protein